MGTHNGIFQKKSENNYSNISNNICSMDVGCKLTYFRHSITMKKLLNIAIIFCLAVLFSTSQVFAAPKVSTQQQARDKINQLSKLEKAEKNKLFKNQKKLETASGNLKVSKTQYNTVENELNNLERQLANATRDFNSTDYQMKNRIRQIFKAQRTGMFELILSARDMNAFLDVLYFERVIIKRDYRRMVSLKQRAKQITQMKRDVESKKKYLAQSIKTINSQQRDIERAIAQNQNMINRLQTDRRYYEKAERELARQSGNLESMLSKQGSTVANASTGFVKPIGGRITSPFGWRTHPIFKSRTFHSGVDIGGPNYGSIIASNGGRVVYSGWYGGYGKVVIIDHGTINGRPTSTLYAHMSTIKVQQGQQVKKGQVIGLEGTTGYSTGPHCHFEVRINGKPNNPMNYI